MSSYYVFLVDKSKRIIIPPQDISLIQLKNQLIDEYPEMEINQAEQFCIKMYEWALLKAQEKQVEQSQYKRSIQNQLKLSKVPFSKIKHFTLLSRKDWIEDLLETTKDVKLALQTFPQYRKKLQKRAKMHFSNDHKQFLSKLTHKNTPTKNVIAMYNKSESKQWSQDQIHKFSQHILQNTAYLVGLTKGNGVIIENDFIVTCAHTLIDEEDNPMKFRCFVTGSGSYGIAKIEKHGIFMKSDVGIAKIIQHYKIQNRDSSLFLDIPASLKFKNQFSPTRCLQVGLLFNDEPQELFIKVFETAQGFIQKNLYENKQDQKLIDQMGLLIHDCYGLWGTSGSPLWTVDGQLLGIHNAWNQNGYNINMIVHDDDNANCRVAKQYERRAIGVHVLQNLFEQWKKHQAMNQTKNHQNEQLKDPKSTKKIKQA